MEFYAALKEHTEAAGALFLCSPFGIRSARELQGLGVQRPEDRLARAEPLPAPGGGGRLRPAAVPLHAASPPSVTSSAPSPSRAGTASCSCTASPPTPRPRRSTTWPCWTSLRRGLRRARSGCPTTRWIRCSCPPLRCSTARARWRSTSRSRGQAPAWTTRSPWSPRLSHGWWRQSGDAEADRPGRARCNGCEQEYGAARVAAVIGTGVKELAPVRAGELRRAPTARSTPSREIRSRARHRRSETSRCCARRRCCGRASAPSSCAS